MLSQKFEALAIEEHQRVLEYQSDGISNLSLILNNLIDPALQKELDIQPGSGSNNLLCQCQINETIVEVVLLTMMPGFYCIGFSLGGKDYRTTPLRSHEVQRTLLGIYRHITRQQDVEQKLLISLGLDSELRPDEEHY